MFRCVTSHRGVIHVFTRQLPAVRVVLADVISGRDHLVLGRCSSFCRPATKLAVQDDEDDYDDDDDDE